MVEHFTAALSVAGLIPARNIHLYDLHLVVLGLAVCVCELMYNVCKHTHDTGILYRVNFKTPKTS